MALRKGAMAYVIQSEVDGMAAVGLVTKVESVSASMCEKARGGLLGAPFRLGMSITQRSLAFSSVVDAMHKEDTHNIEHLFMSHVGVVPAMQGRGLAGRVGREMLADADKVNLPMYLYTGNARNEAMYAKLGFVKCSEVAVSESVTMRGMLRPRARP